MLARWEPGWGIRGLQDWASYPALLLLLWIIGALAVPIIGNFTRYQEHQADQSALEVTHGLTPEVGQVGAQTFNVLGDLDLTDPDPGPLRIFVFYDHQAILDRIRYCLSYDPWSNGKSPEFIK